MGLADDLASYRPNRPSCGAGELLQQLKPEDLKVVLEALHPDSDVPVTHVAKTLTNHGYRISAETLRRHRNSVCSCEQNAKK